MYKHSCHTLIFLFMPLQRYRTSSMICACLLVPLDLESGSDPGQSLRAVCFYNEGIVNIRLVYVVSGLCIK